MKLPPLTQVQCALRLTALSGIPDIGESISSFLDPSPLYSLKAAAATRSTRLFRRVLVVNESVAAEQPLRRHELALAIHAAIKNNDLVMVQKIHETHPEPLNVRSLALAFEFGTLDMVQWVLANRHDRLCSPQSLGSLCHSCVRGALKSIGRQDVVRVVQWLSNIDLQLICDKGTLFPALTTHMMSSVALIQWAELNDFLLPRDAGAILGRITERGSVESISSFQYLVERGYSLSRSRTIFNILHSCCQPELEPLVDVVVSSHLCDSFRDRFRWERMRVGGRKVLQFDRAAMDGTDIYADERLGGVPPRIQLAKYAALYGHVDMLKWLYEEHGIFPQTSLPLRLVASEQDTLEMYEWFTATGENFWTEDESSTPARLGFLSVIEWLHVNQPHRLKASTMETAARYGHFDIVRFLHASRNNGNIGRTLGLAAERGHFHIVKYLLRYRSGTNVNEAMAAAAVAGHVETVQWIYENCSTSCVVCVKRVVLSQPTRFFLTESESVLEVIRWLDSHTSTSPNCIGECIRRVTSPIFHSLLVEALSAGDLSLVKYLETYHRDELSFDAGHDISIILYEGGHVSTLEWVRPHFTQSEAALLSAARQSWNGEVRAWVDSLEE